jgi:hypothetical protein
MAIDATFPTLSSSVQPKAAGFPVQQPKVNEDLGEKTQTQNAVAPTGDSEGASENGSSVGNKEGRGQLVDLKI